MEQHTEASAADLTLVALCRAIIEEFFSCESAKLNISHSFSAAQ